ncbi:MAG: Short-chain dehydrogenase/reductase [Akkermansiaceae bacterium]|nr:Short-chain dehydrogenase/reductase [Akkermansiaceae bacterium]
MGRIQMNTGSTIIASPIHFCHRPKTTYKNMTSTILITGCSSGFGKATAQHFLAHGWNVIATMRTPQPGLFTESERLLVTALDVTVPDSISAAIETGIARFGKIDVFVNNAGIGMFSAHEVTPDATIRQVFETNTFGVMAANRAIIPHMRERRAGTIINVTSSVGIAPMPLVAVYTASKFAVEGFSESLSYELARFGIRVRIVEPGLAPTTSFGANSGDRCDNLVPEAYAAYAGRYLRSMQDYPTAYASEADIAEAVYAAATDEAPQLRYPAGPDSVMMAELRRTLPEQEFMTRMRGMFGGNPED